MSRLTQAEAAAGTSASATSRPITFVGTLPPPVTGLTAMTGVMVHALQESGPVRCINWSRNKPIMGLRWKCARVLGACKSVVGLISRGRRPQEVLYYPANSSWGMLYDIMIVALGRVLGYQVVLHHHVYSYIREHDWRMAALVKVAGPRAVHVVHCQQMVEDFSRQYPSATEFLTVPPTIVSGQLQFDQIDGQEGGSEDRDSEDGRSASQPFTIGLISNLTLVKGLDVVVDTFDRLLDSGADVRLVLAGPCLRKDGRELVDATLTRWPGRVEYRGPVYGVEKAKFFADIDAFLFPTRYNHESWGIVLTEALEAGRPVVAFNRGCIPWIVRDGCGEVVEQNDDFVEAAADLVLRWIDDPECYQLARRRARERSQVLKQDAAEQLPAFVNRLRELGAEGELS